MDWYLDFHSHYPPWVKRGLVRYLFDRARTITTKQNDLQKEEHHLTRVLRQNGYPSAFIHSSSKPPRWDMEANKTLPLEEEHRPPPVIERVSEDVGRVCRMFGMKVVFRSGHSLHSMLTKVKGPLMMEKQAKVVYRILCSWRGLHWRDSEKTGDQSEGAQGCMSEGSTGEVSIGRACMNEPPSNQVGGCLSG